jgi:hypothetical protein
MGLNININMMMKIMMMIRRTTIINEYLFVNFKNAYILTMQNSATYVCL